MKRIVLSEDCRVVGFSTRRRRNERSGHVEFGEVDLELMMPFGLAGEARISVPKLTAELEEVHVEQRYRLVLEPID